MKHSFWQSLTRNKETANINLATFLRVVYNYEWLKNYNWYDPKTTDKTLDPRYKLQDGSW